PRLPSAAPRPQDARVNLLLLDRAEIDDRGEAVVGGRRAHHLLAVLRAAAGSSVRAGIVDGPRGHAQVLATSAATVRLRVDCREPAPPATDALLLAVPRPAVPQRPLQHAAPPRLRPHPPLRPLRRR